MRRMPIWSRRWPWRDNNEFITVCFVEHIQVVFCFCSFIRGWARSGKWSEQLRSRFPIWRSDLPNDRVATLSFIIVAEITGYKHLHQAGIQQWIENLALVGEPGYSGGGNCWTSIPAPGKRPTPAHEPTFLMQGRRG